MARVLIGCGILWLALGMSSGAGHGDEPLPFSGDLRLRFNHFDAPAKVAREKFSVRLRLGTEKKVNEAVTFGARIATGGNNPISADGTLTDFLGRPEFRVDRAYLNWKPQPHTTVTAGKFANPFQRTEMIWDEDVCPGGLVVTTDLSPSGRSSIKVRNVAGLLTVFEVKEGSDLLLYADQVQWDLGRGRNAALAYYAYQSPQSLAKAYDKGTFTSNDTNRRNQGAFVSEGFRMVNLLLQYRLPLKTEASVTATLDWVKNTRADDQDQGFRFLVEASQGKGVGAWQATLGYTDVEADATLAAFTDSNWSGTDCRGFKVGYQKTVAPNTDIALTYFAGQRPFAGIGTAHNLYLDFKTKF